MKNAALILLVLIVNVWQVQAQEASLDSLIDVILSEDDWLSLPDSGKRYHFIYANVDYGNRTIYAGRDLGIDQVNLTGQLFYFHPSGLNFGIGGIWYSEIEPHYNATIASVGYRQSLSKDKKFSLRGSYDRYFTSKSDSAEDYSIDNGFNASLSYYSRAFSSRLGGSLLTGTETIPQVTWEAAGHITLYKFGLFNDITLDPSLLFFFSTQTIEISGSGSGNRPTGTKETFGLMNTHVKLPITLTVGDFDLELGYNIHFPKDDPAEAESNKVTTSFNISLGYFILLNP